MKLSTAFGLWLRQAFSGPFRYFRAVREHRHVFFWPGVSIGPGCRFGRNVKVLAGARLAQADLGDHSYIGGESSLKNCRVGKFCSIGEGVQIGLGVHPTSMISTYPGFYASRASGATRFASTVEALESSPVVLGNDVWVGNSAIILDGVEIGHGSVVAAGAVVTKSVAAYSIVAGVPARIVRQRFDDRMVRFLLAFAWWDRDEAFLRENAPLFAEPDAFAKKFMSANE
jgi:acetyltransferase-like isoleucine patch superfamily enzyme